MSSIPSGSSGLSRNPSRKIHALHVDMTPMVDLGFLLITFFVFTAQLSAPKALKLIMPADSKVPMPVRCSISYTVVADSNGRVAWYGCGNGEAVNHGRGRISGENGLRDALQEMRLRVIQQTGNGRDMFVVIKPLATCDYKTVVNVLDEMSINEISRYALADPGPIDKVDL